MLLAEVEEVPDRQRLGQFFQVGHRGVVGVSLHHFEFQGEVLGRRLI